MSIVLQVKDKVQRLISEFYAGVTLGQNGALVVPWDSARVIVRVSEYRDSSAVIEIIAVTNWSVPESPELFKHIATEANGYRFGSLSLYDNKDGTYNVNFSHAILGDSLDPEELKAAIGAVGWTANDIDDKIKAKFGGKMPGDA